MRKIAYLLGGVVGWVLLSFSLVAAQDAPLPDLVYGQPDFNSNGAGTSATSLNFPLGVAVGDNLGLFVADRNNHRVLYFADDGDTTADQVYGQFGNFDAHIMNNNGGGNSGSASADTLNTPTFPALDSSGGLYVTDRENRRVLYYAADGNTTADQVYGQFGNFNGNMVNNNGFGGFGDPSAMNIGVFTLGVAVDNNGGGIYVSDSGSSRVLYFANDGDDVADRVYGQSDNFRSDAANNDGAGHAGAISARSLSFPRGLAVDSDGGLYVADRYNSRVLYFAPDGDTTADRVYGQFGSFTSGVINNDGSGNAGAPSADSLNHPKAVTLNGSGGVYIADSLNHRILYFAPDGDTTADRVFGQGGSFTTNAANSDGGGNPTAGGLNAPQGIAVGSDGRLIVGDTDNNRVLIFLNP